MGVGKVADHPPGPIADQGAHEQQAGDQEHAGSLNVGKRGDVVVLSQDIFKIPPKEILGTQVAYTIAGGNVVYPS